MPQEARFRQALRSSVIFTDAIAGVSIAALDLGAKGARIDAYDASVGDELVDFDEIVGTGAGVGNVATLAVSGSGILRIELFEPMFFSSIIFILLSFASRLPSAHRPVSFAFS